MALINTTTTGVLGSTFFADGTGDLTIQQNGVTVNKITSAPAFSAYPSAAQTITNNTQTILNANVELFDTASCYNNTGSTVGGIPAYSFLPNVAGYYQVNAAWFSGTSANGVYSLIYKNGAVYQQTAVIFYSGGQVLGVNCLVYLNGTSDYIAYYVNQGQGTSYTTLASRPDLNYFAASMIRSA